MIFAVFDVTAYKLQFFYIYGDRTPVRPHKVSYKVSILLARRSLSE